MEESDGKDIVKTLLSSMNKGEGLNVVMLTITEAVTAAGDHQQVSPVVPDEEMEIIARMLSCSRDSENPVSSPKPKKVKSVDYRKV